MNATYLGIAAKVAGSDGVGGREGGRRRDGGERAVGAPPSSAALLSAFALAGLAPTQDPAPQGGGAPGGAAGGVAGRAGGQNREFAQEMPAAPNRSSAKAG